MKKITTFLMSFIIVFSLTACGNDRQAEKTTSEKAEVTVSEQDISEETSESGSDNETGSTEGKTLVVYYSASGNTKEVANYIAQATDGEMFEIEPVKPYTDADLDWTDDNSRVSVEHENEDKRDVELVSATVDDWDSYDTVFIGYAGGIIGLN